MFSRWTDLWSDMDRSFSVMNELQRRMNQVFSDYETYRSPDYWLAPRGTWPPLNLYDNGDELLLRALVPGLSEKSLKITANQDVVTLSGERTTTIPEGYSVHRQERGNVKFSRSFSFPCKCDVEKMSASVKDGVLTMKVAKAPEAKPRQITVSAK